MEGDLRRGVRRDLEAGSGVRVAAVEEVAAVWGALGADSGFVIYEWEELVGFGCHCGLFRGSFCIYICIWYYVEMGNYWCGKKLVCSSEDRLQEMHGMYTCRFMSRA